MIKVLQSKQRHLVASSFASQNCISWNVQSLPVLNLKFNRNPTSGWPQAFQLLLPLSIAIQVYVIGLVCVNTVGLIVLLERVLALLI